MAATARTRVLLGDWPRLTRFYGLSPFELARMPHWLTRLYADKLPELESEEGIRGYTVAALPHTTERDRDRVLRGMRERAGISVPVTTINVQTDEGKAALSGLGIGLVVDSSESV